MWCMSNPYTLLGCCWSWNRHFFAQLKCFKIWLWIHDEYDIGVSSSKKASLFPSYLLPSAACVMYVFALEPLIPLTRWISLKNIKFVFYDHTGIVVVKYCLHLQKTVPHPIILPYAQYIQVLT